ncbi:M15 family metallopeptidase [Brevibacillus halotolerans]|uniref:M15 family metallopeptidase n=1 Tax=Brevibacillus TaxID=55080 RepID=UPI00215C06CD|nr:MULTISPECIES: M15 family metallopeptidase [Brevibacillus]MCR8964670.1 M15 family metallopeptidase [Brevibacillus laterosporus]MCR8993620.1 M15 family metallopeptidase [Brevibacillus laterosporus]MCZ0836825.1 M15 family metallopeptidase [Brevibacillus halotolerans]WPS85904.1 M15 family metallopeptidase [Brevibacillus halotolerans]
MKSVRTISATAMLVALSASLVAGCQGTPNKTPSTGSENAQTAETKGTQPSQPTEPLTDQKESTGNETEGASSGNTSAPATSSEGTTVKSGNKAQAVSPESIQVLVNKQYKLPDSYKPQDLVYPDVPFLFQEKIEKRMMRQEAADALQQLFAGAKQEGIMLAGVSAYRSHTTQTNLFNRYVKKDGEEAAKKYSAEPGHSEHETGLAIDVSGSTGKCAAEDCFEGTPEAVWLADHAHEYGFIIRYPKGKEAITGYQYEPWHLRYVGKEAAGEIHDKGITLEEYSNTPTA